LNKHGWRGINIDADNTKIEKFKKLRPNDCNIVAAVSDRTESLNFGRYPSGFANRIISKNQEDKKSNIGESPLEIVEIKTKSLTEIIDSTKYAGKKIDFLDVDCEGYDFNVIKSLDIEKYSPKIIAFEAFNEDERKTICEYLLKYRYKLSDIVDITTICILDK
jgi:FkbM family methyltransferase